MVNSVYLWTYRDALATKKSVHVPSTLNMRWIFFFFIDPIGGGIDNQELVVTIFWGTDQTIPILVAYFAS